MICRTFRGSRSHEDDVQETQSTPPDARTASVELVRRRLLSRCYHFRPKAGARRAKHGFVVHRSCWGGSTRHRCPHNPDRGEHMTDVLLRLTGFHFRDIEMVNSRTCEARMTCFALSVFMDPEKHLPRRPCEGCKKRFKRLAPFAPLAVLCQVWG